MQCLGPGKGLYLATRSATKRVANSESNAPGMRCPSHTSERDKVSCFHGWSVASALLTFNFVHSGPGILPAVLGIDSTVS